MSEDIVRITVGRHAVGIIGLKQLLSEMASTHADKSDEEVLREMFERLGRLNYIPGEAKSDYAEAFLREFYKALGRPYKGPARSGVEIKILGPGCSQCDGLEKEIMEVLAELNLAANVEHVRDYKEIASYGIMGVPALIINGKPLCVGSVPPRHKLKAWLVEAGE
ncbi:MAG: thioredoxin family protein [Acidobacteriota bacterium]